MAALTSRIEVLGVEECEAAMTAFSELAPKAANAALKPAAKILATGIKAQAPVGATGRLRGSVRSLRASGKNVAMAGMGGRLSVGYLVGPQKKGSNAAHLVISGHRIVGHKPNKTDTGKRTRANSFVSRGEEMTSGAVEAAVVAGMAAAIKAVAP